MALANRVSMERICLIGEVIREMAHVIITQSQRMLRSIYAM